MTQAGAFGGDQRRIRIVLADDQAMVRSGLRLILESEPDLVVVGEAATGREAIEVVTRTRPDVVLMDVQMPILDGLAATERLLAGRSADDPGNPVRVVILTTFDLDDYVFEALRAGASGFLLKNAPAGDLIRAVRIVAAGEALLAPEVTRRVVEQFVGRRPPADGATQLARLSAREREVLGLVAAGHSNGEIADLLFLGEATVKTHVGSILAKLGLRDRVAAVIFGYESGLVDDERRRADGGDAARA
jgi:DNA-binding NarL/FixJ family response regulator